MLDMETIGERLRALREEKQLTLEQAAAVAATTKQSLSQIEKGVTKEPGGLAVYRWAEFYGVDLQWLITGKGPRQSGSQSARPDPETLAASLKLIRLTYQNLDAEYDPEANALPLSLAYAYLMARQQSSVTAENVIDFTKYLKRAMGDVDEERGQGVGSTGEGNRRPNKGRQVSEAKA
jgi:transcriptional regulator with XRE-family HTH domain